MNSFLPNRRFFPHAMRSAMAYVGLLWVCAAAALTHPVSWSGADIGAPVLPGTSLCDSVSCRVMAAGADIWGRSDAFHFRYQALAGDGEITARITSLESSDSLAPDGWAKAGVMIRASLAPGAAHAFMALTPRQGAAFQRRPAANEPSFHTAAGRPPFPYGVRLVRQGNRLQGFTSADGRSWSLAGEAVIALPETAWVGLAVTSHQAARRVQAVFRSVETESYAGLQGALSRALALAVSKSDLRDTSEIPIDSFPRFTSSDGRWTFTGARAWTSGFHSSFLRRLQALTQDSTLRAQADARSRALESALADSAAFRGPAGAAAAFALFQAHAPALREKVPVRNLGITAAQESRLLAAAASFKGRFDSAFGAFPASSLGIPGAAGAERTLRIESLPLLELLLWASRNGGDTALRSLAVRHGRKVLAHHLRTDGSVAQEARFDSLGAAFRGFDNPQGLSPSSTWSRGQAWAFYGFTLLYRETGEADFLVAARRTADFFLDHLPADGIPAFDLSLGEEGQPDISAAAIAAAGLLELSRLEAAEGARQSWARAARRLLQSMASPPYLSQDSAWPGLLLHGVEDMPAGIGVDASLIHADAYFLEALQRLRLPPLLPAVLPQSLAPGLNLRVHPVAVSLDSFPLLDSLAPGRTAPAAAFTLGNASPEGPPNPQAFRFQGYLQVTEDGPQTLYARCAGSCRLLLHGEPILETSGGRERSVIAYLQAGLHPLALDYAGAAGADSLRISWSGPSRPKAEVPGAALLRDFTAAPVAVPRAAAGLEYRYFEGTWSRLPVFSTLAPAASGIAGRPGLEARLRPDRFGFSFEGYLEVPVTGEYTFHLRSDDGSRLFLADRLVVDNDGAHAAAEVSGLLRLGAGRHPVRIEYFEATGAETLELRWTGPGIPKGLIPAAAFSHALPPPVFHPPAAPEITEPLEEGHVVNASDAHMEAGPFVDADSGQGHRCTDWEIWTVEPLERIWKTACIGGVEKRHTHLGDGVFEGSHAGARQLRYQTDYRLRVRYRDDGGDSATEWSAYSERNFKSGPAPVLTPLLSRDASVDPAPAWKRGDTGAVALPACAEKSALYLEAPGQHHSHLLLHLSGSDTGTTVTDGENLGTSHALRLRLQAGDCPDSLLLEPSTLQVVLDGEARTLYLPALRLGPGQAAFFWLALSGATYWGTADQILPDFSRVARPAPVPWTVSEPGYRVEVVARNLQLPVNIAFHPNPGNLPQSPKYYVTELYGTIKVVTNSGEMGDFATGLLNFNPTGNFPGSGEVGLTGIAVHPSTGDVYAALLYHATGLADTLFYPKVVRFTSRDGGLTADSQVTVLDMPGEVMGQSHQISSVTFGPDGLLYVHLGDGFHPETAQDLTSFRGKVLRFHPDGRPATDNPFFNAADGIGAADYVYAYGLRNPFGGGWRERDASLYEVENGPSRDRLVRVVPGRNYGWNGTNNSMNIHAAYVWTRAVAPVNLAFIQPGTFGGSGFPASKMDRLFVTESGPTWASGLPARGKRITQFQLDSVGRVLSGPTPFITYAGSGKATVSAVRAGPDGLYFSDLYKDEGYETPIDRGANILRVKWVGVANFTADTLRGAAPLQVRFQDASDVPEASAHLWEFGDGATATGPAPVHVFTAPGTYAVRLTVAGREGAVTVRKEGFITVE